MIKMKEMEEKNLEIKNYIVELISKINSKVNKPLTEEEIARAVLMFKDRQEDLEELKRQVDELATKTFKERQNAHIPLNDIFSYGISGDTLHLHFIPSSIKDKFYSNEKDEYIKHISSQLDDALIKSSSIIENNLNIKQIFAVSPLLRLSIAQNMFMEKGFEIKKTTSPIFLKMFQGKKVFEAKINRDKILEQYGNLNRQKYENTKGKVLSKSSQNNLNNQGFVSYLIIFFGVFIFILVLIFK